MLRLGLKREHYPFTFPIARRIAKYKTLAVSMSIRLNRVGNGGSATALIIAFAVTVTVAERNVPIEQP